MITRNILKTVLLLGCLSALFVLTGDAIGGTRGAVAALLMALLVSGAAYWFSDRLVLRAAHASEAGPDTAPALHAAVEEMAQRAGVPKPRVYLIDDRSPNAFATGRGPSHAAVAVTTGLIATLDGRELRAVLAHELAHITHRDILLCSVAATIAGAVTLPAKMLRLSFLFGNRADDEGESRATTAVMLLVAPLAATLLQLALSRTREFAADRTGADLCSDPMALAGALHKLERGIWMQPLDVNPSTAPLYIVHPLAAAGLGKLFMTHPPVAERVARLGAHGLAGEGRMPAFR